MRNCSYAESHPLHISLLVSLYRQTRKSQGLVLVCSFCSSPVMHTPSECLLLLLQNLTNDLHSSQFHRQCSARCLSLPQQPMASHSLFPGTPSLVFKTNRLWLSMLTILLTPVHFVNLKNSWHLFPVQRRELAHLVALNIYIDGSQTDILG